MAETFDTILIRKKITDRGLEQGDEEELLLIISGMGMAQPAANDEEGEYWVGEDCKECVSDLQRYLRRDDPDAMAFHRAIGHWRVLQQHLLPLLKWCADDLKIVFNVLKVIVKLTMKPEQLGTHLPTYLWHAPSPLCHWCVYVVVVVIERGGGESALLQMPLRVAQTLEENGP